MQTVKLILKRLLLLTGLVATSPLIFVTLLEALLFGRKAERVYGSCKELLALCPTLCGQYLRLAFYWAVCTRISPDACFLFGSMVAHRDTLIRGGGVVGTHSIIGYADIGENVLFGARVSVISGKYQHGRPEERSQDGAVSEEYQCIHIGGNSWIGEGALILADVGAGCTVGAGSVVYKEVPDGITVMGNPARKVSLQATDTAGSAAGDK
jgi:virginiamycin A acetyltransferase